MRRPTVLVVEDDRDTREMYVAWLESLGFAVIAARDGVEGVTYARSTRPDVVLMDIAMPRMDGIQATRCLKSHPDTTVIPVVVISAHTTAEYRRAAREAGAIDFLSKSCDLDTVACRLQLHTV